MILTIKYKVLLVLNTQPLGDLMYGAIGILLSDIANILQISSDVDSINNSDMI